MTANEERDYYMTLAQRFRQERNEALIERDRYAKRMRELEIRARHAVECLEERFSVPEIQEIRRVRGLECLPQLKGETK